MIEIPTVDQLDVRGKRVFYRVDYNVPLDGGLVSDATRIEETIPTLQMLRERDAAIVIASHLGRPKGARVEKYSLAPVRAKLEEIMSVPVAWASDCIGTEAKAAASRLGPGEILLVENLRFHAGEEENDPEFAAALRELGEMYVNDAFGASHRAHASIVALPRLFPHSRRAGGLLLARELQFLQKVTEVEERPFVALLGGAKIAGKIEPLEALVERADMVLIGGGMANTFLAAKGVPMGASLVDHDSLDVARRILAGSSRAELVLPDDLIVTDSLDAPTRVRNADVATGLQDDERAVDIGERTIEAYKRRIEGARTIFWNGPMGVFERDEFAKGTLAMAEAVATSGGTTIVGGGESVEAVNQSGFAERISHISTGGGASLEFIAGSMLPGVAVLLEE
ncbi:MAG TPA: phosphoglycerate kinase [Thermoanaerobaculia bacterium]|nr:phosphoglycerate kinase [Thermoanaerobaculia bacterium]